MTTLIPFVLLAVRYRVKRPLKKALSSLEDGTVTVALEEAQTSSAPSSKRFSQGRFQNITNTAMVVHEQFPFSQEVLLTIPHEGK